MKKPILFLLGVMGYFPLMAQEIFLSSTLNELYKLDINTCEYEYVVKVNAQVYDISFDPQGNLYGISGSGRFYTIDQTTGLISTQHNFQGSSFNSLTIDGEGIVYAIGHPGILWSYDLNTGEAKELGQIGYGATGDLTFYEGNLYVATTGNKIVLIPLDNPSNSSIVINGNIVGDIWGIVSFAEDCSDVNSYAITNGYSDVYQIDFENNTLNFVCELEIEIGGGASTFEFFASKPIVIEEENMFEPNCSENDGWIELVASGGVGTIRYSLDGETYQDDGYFDNLFGGMYTIFIQDDNGCTIKQEFELESENVPIINNIEVINASCALPNGSLLVSANGGTGQIQYSIDGNNFQISNTFSNLDENVYYITIQDENNCRSYREVEVINSGVPSIDNLGILDTKCNLSNGGIEVTVNGGSPPYTYSLNGEPSQNSNQFESLSAGSFNLQVADINNCASSETFFIASSEAPTITYVDVDPSTCELPNGSIEIIGEGGNGTHLFSVNGQDFQESASFIELISGSYSVSLMDEEGCIAKEVVSVSGSPAIQLVDIKVNAADCGEINGEITLEVDGGTGDLNVWLDDLVYIDQYHFQDLEAGTYLVNMEDELGCELKTSATILSKECPIFFPNIFSPNGDGDNDVFQIVPHAAFVGQFTSFSIYDRWGNEVFSVKDFDPSEVNWDGRFNGQSLDSGVYIYSLQTRNENGEGTIRQGDITLIR
ncbi:MAG: gliding motility-associated C-terminal domain-containing protein [Saprospiraceae bacterium]|nr:gliding motility-associated C-terminal domain-containing protein [Saprospiraceae bacterium]